MRYQPSEAQEGDIAAWVRHVREVVRRFGANRLVVGLQITNEVNITFSPDSSDGGYDGAREALVQRVIAAKQEARRLGHDQLRIGFNWAYRTDPANETSFWQALRDRGGPEFVAVARLHRPRRLPRHDLPAGGERHRRLPRRRWSTR